MNNDIEEIIKKIKGDRSLPNALRDIVIKKIDKTNVATRKNVLIKEHQSKLSPIPGTYYKPISRCFKIEV
jgi:hypothetical protein